jgi:aerobic-type carbon monoxide dehydrogenase small subunit (CoxS/CutS family)
MSRILFTLTINGARHEIECEPQRTLLDILRDELGLLGTKQSCVQARCGVCTVLLDGKAVNSCILFALQCEGRGITTIEGVGEPDDLHPIQAAFVAHGAVQCGYCSPAMVLTAKSFLDRNPGVKPSRKEIREALAGTLCRCTGYQKLVDAVAAAAAEMSRESRNAAVE